MNAAFLDKLIERIGRIRPEEVRNYLLRLSREKGFLETIFNALHEGVIVTDAEGRINFLNDAACELFGLDPDESLGKRLSERVRGLDWDSLAGSERVITRDMEVFYPRNRFLNFYVVPLSLEKTSRRRAKAEDEDELVGYAVILRDFTESRRSTEEAIQSERISAVTLLAAGVAHEIGNPLNSLHIHLQLLERKLKNLPDETREDLANSVLVAREEIKRLDDIINQFLRAIRPAPLQVQPESLNAVLEESLAFLSPEIKDRDIIVEAELPRDLPALPLDRNQVKQAFYNVIKNSLQAMKQGGILHIKTEADDHFVSVVFTDTGGGIPPETLSRIFDPYFTTKSDGTGLGLMIVRRIVREHGGEIDIMNNAGRGITLTIRLPRRDSRVRMLEGGNG